MLAVGFFIIALFYAIVGFGGGTSYLALLSVSGISYELIPKIGLICNILVVSGGCWHYFKKGYMNHRLILPFVVTSIPMAFIGGLFPVSEEIFFVLLSIALILAGIRLLFDQKIATEKLSPPSFATSLIVGAGLGLLSGVVGIGGGIFLSPLMLNLKWARPKEVAAAASLFILLNSISGLAGQLIKGFEGQDLVSYAPLFLAVLAGGQIGSRIGTHPKISHLWVQRGTAGLILFVSIRLLSKTLGS